ncbi:glycosyltransferase [Sphingomonas crusticola]|uniref:glycosyltransferase n=1 Tax=Sphingomonas crusticola TaxID=1697973 RepID=UPI0013C31160|nr:glycosyltransferase [Sphingomonas crusticola]
MRDRFAEARSELAVAQPVPPAARILIVLHDFAGGGTERVAIRLANQWAKTGRTVRIFCGNETGPVRAMVEDEVAVEPASRTLPRSAVSRVRLGFALARAAKRFAPDVIFAPGNFHFLVLAAFSLRDRGRTATCCKISNPLVRTDRRGPGGWLRRLTLKALTARIDILIAMSPALRAEAVALVGEERVSAQWEPIFADIHQPAMIEREPDLIVAAGRLEPQKNFALAIEAMAHLSRWTSARLVILGEGSERARLERMIERLGLHQCVLLPGHVRDITPWLRRASCFLMTSHYEGYPASLVEALVCGTPAIVTPFSAALNDILPHAARAVTVRPDPEAIAWALQDLLRRPYLLSIDNVLFARHGESSAAASYLKLMDDMLARTRRRHQ